MARVVGPLHSDDASGLYGGVKAGTVFSRWRSTRYVRSYAAGSNPRTVQQLRNRTVLSCLNELWKTFGDAEKAYWATAGSEWDLPGWQMFCRYNLGQALQGWMPQDVKNSQHLTEETAPTALAATVVDNVLVISWTDDAGSFSTGVHVGVSPTFTVAMSNCGYATMAQGALDRQCTIRVAPGTYYVRARSGAVDGGVGAPTAAVGPYVIV
jgi:hypothetical protein